MEFKVLNNPSITEAASPTGGILYMPIAGVDHWISTANFLKAVTDAIALIQAGSSAIYKSGNKTANFTYEFAQYSRIEAIDIYWISGTPTVSVNYGDEDLISNTELSESYNKECMTIVKRFDEAATLNFNVTGGTAKFMVYYRLNIN